MRSAPVGRSIHPAARRFAALQTTTHRLCKSSTFDRLRLSMPCGREVQLLSRAQKVPLTRANRTKKREAKTSRLSYVRGVWRAAGKGECVAEVAGASSGWPPSSPRVGVFPTHSPRVPHAVRDGLRTASGGAFPDRSRWVRPLSSSLPWMPAAVNGSGGRWVRRWVRSRSQLCRRFRGWGRRVTGWAGRAVRPRRGGRRG